MAANNAAPLQPLPEFHTTVSSVNFECTRALSRKRTPAPIESARPRGRRDEDLGISSCVPRKRTTFLVVRQIRSNLSIESASPPPFSLLLFLPHIFVIFGSPMFTHPLLFGTTCNRFPCATLVVPLISTRFSLRGSLSRFEISPSPPSPRRGRIARVAHSNPGRAKNRTRLLLATVFSSLPPSLSLFPSAYFRNLWIADVYAATRIQSKSTLDGY